MKKIIAILFGFALMLPYIAYASDNIYIDYPDNLVEARSSKSTLNDGHSMLTYKSVTVSQIAAGYSHSLVLLSDGSLWAFGDNTYGQLGIGEVGGNSSIPIKVGTDFTAVTAGSFHSAALKGRSLAFRKRIYHKRSHRAAKSGLLQKCSNPFF